MELASLAIGLASLYSACIETAHRIESYQNFQVETRQLSAKFQADRAILQRWANTVGILQNGLSDTYDRRLDSQEIAVAVREILKSLQTLLKVTESAQGKSRHISTSKSVSARQYTHVQDSMQSTSTSSRKRDKISWTFGGKEKFIALVDSFSILVGKLNELVPIDTGLEQLSLTRHSPQAVSEGKFSKIPYRRDSQVFQIRNNTVSWSTGRYGVSKVERIQSQSTEDTD